MHKTNFAQGTALILLGLLISLLMIEISLRAGGRLFKIVSESQDKHMADKRREGAPEYRILALGESTTAKIRNDASSWPAELERILNNRTAEIKFIVYNEGIPGTNTGFILSHLESNLARYKPHMVISMMGTNRGGFEYKKERLFSGPTLSTFRIIKLADWLKDSYSSRFTNQSKYDYYMDAFDSINASNANCTLIKDDSVDINDPSYIFKENIEEYNLVDKTNFMEIGDIYLEQKNFSIAVSFYEQAIKVFPEIWPYLHLASVYIDQKCYADALIVLRNAAALDPESDPLMFTVSKFFYEMGYSFSNGIYEYDGKAHINSDYYKKANYNTIYQTLSQRRIKYAAMQYPSLDITILEDFFEEENDILFIENKKNFEAASKIYGNEQLFIDMFGRREMGLFNGNYGHATRLGNIIIAENAADSILKELNLNG